MLKKSDSTVFSGRSRRASSAADVSGRSTGTDADEIGVSRAGVPTVLISLPEKYMHTSVETISLDTLEESSRLLAHFVSELDASWEDDLWI